MKAGANGEIEAADSGSRTPAPHPLAPGLHVVAVPIGNLRDITLRALDTLAGVDEIWCEDTRVTARLLSAHGIRASLHSYHEHRAEAARRRILGRLAQGAAVALVSDAGTPLISDPGYKLVRAAHKAGHAVHAVPGPSALIAALSVAGLPTDRVLFAGFPPPRSTRRRRWFEELRPLRATLIVYEAPHRLPATLTDAAEVLGEREAVVARELTKRHEEIRRGPLPALAAEFAARERVLGEIVLLIAPGDAREKAIDEAEIDRMLAERLAAMPLRRAVDEVCALTDRPRREIYARALALKGAGKQEP
ncbi:MAG: 16S rRNA (cytidine(1402)-2'-O)-methyltransferase [Alphaproteobacteria bacterium]|nr:MAG: 16S rRNA (cytidine(1402)-2'-O)-methyltransferase [Alphaproteobacteria bacterium]